VISSSDEKEEGLFKTMIVVVIFAIFGAPRSINWMGGLTIRSALGSRHA